MINKVTETEIKVGHNTQQEARKNLNKRGLKTI